MHFSKTYTQLLLSLPPELQENSVQYRQLKKIINQIVEELSSHGLNPPLLHRLLEAKDDYGGSDTVARLYTADDAADHLATGAVFPKVIYEFNKDPSKIEPRLRISIENASEIGNLLRSGALGKQGGNKAEINELGDEEETHSSMAPVSNLLWTMQKRGSESHVSLHDDPPSPASDEVIIPLVFDSRFFDLLYTALESISTQLQTVEGNALETLTALSRTIADSAHPASSSRSVLGRNFHPHSPLTDHAGSIRVRPGNLSKSDLYSWREFFQLYTEAEVFESMHERDRGERSVEESERRLRLFAQQVTQRGLATRGKFKLKQSGAAVETFLQLNILILNIRKFQIANSEATRKILKKHAKRTALPFLGDTLSSSAPPQLALLPKLSSSSLPRILVQAIGETLLPIIPHLDDYSCLICTSLAFKPIRLDCGHLFCVRCLVKMQKRGTQECPMCRAPSVLVANGANVDWALMNFMEDWFPVEAREKLKANEKEATAEELRELGLDPDAGCIVM